MSLQCDRLGLAVCARARADADRAEFRIVRERIAKLSGRTEFLLVLIVAFGLFIPKGLAALLSPESLALSAAAPPITNAAIFRTILYEGVILTALALFLRARGWTVARLGVVPTWGDSFLALGLFLICNVLYYVLAMGLMNIWPAFAHVAMRTHLAATGLDGVTVLIASVVNPVFEEGLLCGYIVSVLKERRGITTAINVSVGIRVFCHFYQGALGVVAIAPMGLLFAYWYARTGRLWPLLVAHALQDFLALLFSGG